MGAFPKRSSGVLVAAMGDGAIAYDLATETAHHLNASAGALLVACDGGGDLDDAVAAWARQGGVSATTVAADVAVGLAELERLALIGRRQPFSEPAPLTGSTAVAAAGATTGEAHRVIDHDVVLRSEDRPLLAELDGFLAMGRTPAPAVANDGQQHLRTVIDVRRESGGHVVLEADREWTFADAQACRESLTSVINEYAVGSRSCAVLHAGAVRSPGGEVLVLPAPSGNGKSTLTGAFVAAGWDYLGDEAIGVRSGSSVAVGYPKRLSIGGESGEVLGRPELRGDIDPAELRPDVAYLGGDVGPVSRVVLPRFQPGASGAVERLTPSEAVVDLLANTLNLARAGQVGLDAICDLAGFGPVDRLVHRDAHEAVALIERTMTVR
ncbi:MAG: hypothetical protein KDB24_16070 [Microthrixaceae bacterium]|nr:hypothetical protein [Microthrixaceae bacterium]